MLHDRPHPLFISSRLLVVCLSFFLALGAAASEINPNSKIPPELQAAQITEKLGGPVSIQDLTFTDEEGKKVQLSQYFRGFRPVILTMVYYGCPGLCGYFLNGFLDSLKGLSWTAGQRFEVVTVSINPQETYELAAAKKASLMKAYGRPEGVNGWHFLTGDEANIKKLAGEVGFGYRYDEKEKQYAHSVAAIVLTPDGKVSRYLYGISFPSKDLRLALLEASNGKIGTVMDRVLLFCFHYDPHARGYSLAVMRIMQAGSASSVLAIGGFLLVFWRKQRRQDGEV